MISVHVGDDDDRRFLSVHQGLVTQISSFFEAAMRKGWKEGEEGIVRLPEESHAAFCTFLAFLYTGQIYSERAETEDSQEWNHLEEAWLLGEHLLSTSFKDSVVDAMISKLQEGKACPLSMFPVIFRNSTTSAGVRRLLVDVAAYSWSESDLASQNNLSDIGDVHIALSRVLMSRVHSPKQCAPYKSSDVGCHYHEHQKVEQCYRRLFDAD